MLLKSTPMNLIISKKLKSHLCGYTTAEVVFMYNAYKDVRNAVWQTLIDCSITTLPIPLKSIVGHFRAKLMDNDKVNILRDNQLGCLAVMNDELYIVLDRSVSIQRQRYTIAHEIGHIALGHNLNGVTLNRDNVIIYADVQEYQAERFAIDILAPACILWGLNLHTAEEIAKVCGISMSSAQRRAERMEILYQRNMFLSHPLERQVFQQFQKFISENKIL